MKQAVVRFGAGQLGRFAQPTHFREQVTATIRPRPEQRPRPRFRRVDLANAVQTVKTAPEGWYVVLKNPAKDAKLPTQGKMSTAELNIGRKVNIPGPVSFALWPGQMAKVLKGHNIRSNQYLLVRVYDEESATKNWKNTVIKPQADSTEHMAPLGAAPETLTMGQQFIIKGTEVSFYIPPTGVEVVPNDEGELVRNAVTLARLEYCLLLDENGNKRYEKGPAVVFPRPTEAFVERDLDEERKTRKFRAIELNESSGIYVKVIADYEDGGTKHKIGEELFITGKETMIYFPREEHAIVRYGSSEVHYGIAIPAGEARYVLNRLEGGIKKVIGPAIFLPDPRKEVVVRRILDYKTCSLLFPNNISACEHNAALLGTDVASYMREHPYSVAGIGLAAAAVAGGRPLGATGPQGAKGVMNMAYSNDMPIGESLASRGLDATTGRGFSGDQFQRKNTYTAPRSITIDSKFDGAVAVDIWTGYAMMLVCKSGERKVVQGPKTVLLDFDESPQVLTLSRGKPKTTDNLLRTAFLLTVANKVSDIITVETKDFCRLSVKLSYRLNFEGDPDKWFDVENYVKFLCDHMRSKIRSAIQRIGVEEFYGKSTDILRDVILGASKEDGSQRPGTAFKENGMRIYDVEVLGVEMENQDIEKMFIAAQRDVIQGTLTLAAARRKLSFTEETEGLNQRDAEVKAETRRKSMELQGEEVTRKLVLDLASISASRKAEAEALAKELAAETARIETARAKFQNTVSQRESELALDERGQAMELARIAADAQAVVEKARAISPDLIAALTAFSDRSMIEKVTASMAPLAMIKDTGVLEVVGDLLKGTSIAKHLLPANGSSSSVRS